MKRDPPAAEPPEDDCVPDVEPVEPGDPDAVLGLDALLGMDVLLEPVPELSTLGALVLLLEPHPAIRTVLAANRATAGVWYFDPMDYPQSCASATRLSAHRR